MRVYRQYWVTKKSTFTCLSLKNLLCGKRKQIVENNESNTTEEERTGEQ